MLRREHVCLMYETGREILCLYIRDTTPQDRGEQRPLRDGPIGQDRQRGDAHIVEYYAPEQRVKPRTFLGVWGGAERRAGARRRGRGYQRPPDSSSAMRRNALKNTRLGVRRKKAGAPKGPSLRPGRE